ncbi:VOC family protein [Paraburkholderia sp. GAS199]|uniref:VOC family protein n=1 Tax=Paraburkholderia sp. GAS199 TaxID=3035126 RepID=UPI003D1C29CC
MYVQSYVFFNGRCEEALDFYTQKLGAEVMMKMRYKDAPPDAQATIRPGIEEKIMHASIKLGSTIWMASDGHCDPAEPPMSGFNISLTADSTEAAEKYFNALAEGGTVNLPFQPTFWSKGFGMVKDRFGLGWMVSSPEEQA